jgi:hypothetical protein
MLRQIGAGAFARAFTPVFGVGKNNWAPTGLLFYRWPTVGLVGRMSAPASQGERSFAKAMTSAIESQLYGALVPTNKTLDFLSPEAPSLLGMDSLWSCTYSNDLRRNGC